MAITAFRIAPFAAAKVWRVRGFPYYVLDEGQKREELRKLLNYDHSKLISKNSVIRQSMHGLSLAWSYFPHMWSVRAGGKRTPMELFSDPALLTKALEKRGKLRGRTKRELDEERNAPNIFSEFLTVATLTPSSVRKALRIFTNTQAVSNFRPTAAAAIYHELLPAEGGVTWDMSMGWGGRLLGAVSCDKVHKYIGCDPATDTFAGLKTMEADIKRLLPKRQLETSLHMLGSETKEMRAALPEHGVDLCFTSPPYFDCERYTNEETQSWVKYQRENQHATRDAWLTEFMGYTLDNCEYALKPGGILAVNIADVDTYKGLEDQFVALAENRGLTRIETLELALSSMTGNTRYRQCRECQRLTGNEHGIERVGASFGGKWKKCVKHTHKFEPVFVFRRKP